MFSDLDKSSAFIMRRSFKENKLDICDDETLRYGALYEDLQSKKDKLDRLGYTVPVMLPLSMGGVVNIRLLLPYNGTQFVHMAYMTILGRVPEKPAVVSLQAALSADSSNETKINILKKIGTSQEAKNKGVILTGFDTVELDQLLQYSDREFISNAYIHILLRTPDAEGMTNNLERLRSSEFTPVEIINRLRYSAEGEKHGVEIIGLDDAFRKRMKRKKIVSIPVIGRIGKFFVNLFRINRRLEELTQENYYLRDKLRDERVALTDGINKLRLQLSPRIDASDRKTAELANRCNNVDNKLRNLSNQYEDTDNRLTSILSHQKVANSKLTELFEQFDAADSRITELSGQYEAADSRITELSGQCETADSRITELSGQCEATDSRITKLSGQYEAADSRITELSGQFETAESRITELSGQCEAVDSRITELSGQYEAAESRMNELNYTCEVHAKYLSEQSEAITKVSQEMDRRSLSYDNTLRELDGYAHQIGGNVLDINRELSSHGGIISEYVHEDKKTIQMLLAEVFSLKARINELERGTAGTAEKANSDTAEASPSCVPASNVYSSIDYFDFENHFRGSREHVKSVQKIYIPYFEGRKNVLDLGCGRGEFTELLLENNIGVTGVDQYEPYVEYMKSLGLPVIHGDAIEYLNRQTSTDGIFLGQVVEHISVDQIVAICNMAYEKLEEGSCLIMETPNPRSLAIYSECFYMDPSHQKPVHPYTLKYIAEKAGFSQVDILYTDSSRMPFSIPKIKENEPDFEKFNEAMQRVSELLYGSQDYAVIARK